MCAQSVRKIISLILSLLVVVSLSTTMVFADTITYYDEDGQEHTASSSDAETNEVEEEEEEEEIEYPTLPEIDLAGDISTSASFTIYILDDYSGTVQYALMSSGKAPNDRSWTTVNAKKNTIDIKSDGDWDFYYRITDTNGLTTTSECYNILLDTKSPNKVTIDIEAVEGDAKVRVKLSATDATSGIADIYYKLYDDTESFKRYTGYLYLSNPGDYEITAYAVDNVGNYSNDTTKSYTLNYSDMLYAPTVDCTDSDEVSNSRLGYSLDDYSSLFDYYYCFVKSGSKSSSKSTYSRMSTRGTYYIDEEGEWDLYVRVMYDDDYEDFKVATCTIDKTNPTVYSVDDISSSSSKNVTLEINAKDDIDGYDLKYSFDRGDTWTSSNTKTIKKTTTFKIGDIRVKDSCGNVGYNTQSYQVDISNISDSYIRQIDQVFYMADGLSISNTATSLGYVNGVGGGYFMPNRQMTRSEFVTILYRVLDLTTESSNIVRYMDVTEDNWAYNYIVTTQRYAVIETDGVYFYPSQVITRAEVAHALNQIIDIAGASTENCPSDATKHKYADDIARVYNTGLMVGYDNGKFGPDNVLTRAQVVTIINRLININDSAINYTRDFVDVRPTDWFYTAVRKATTPAW